jgi:hypothetical protein
VKDGADVGAQGIFPIDVAVGIARLRAGFDVASGGGVGLYV